MSELGIITIVFLLMVAGINITRVITKSLDTPQKVHPCPGEQDKQPIKEVSNE